MFRKRILPPSYPHEVGEPRQASGLMSRSSSNTSNLPFRRATIVTILLMVAIIFYLTATPTPAPATSSSMAPSSTDPSISTEQLVRHKNSLVYLGTKETNTGWKVDTVCLKNKESLVVYGVGAGEDISWDVGLVDRINATVLIFDPTTKSLNYTKPILERYARSHPHQLSHTAEGMSDEKGILTFAMPANPDHVSMRMSDLATEDMTKKVTLPVNTLRNWMAQNQHEYLDILKIDIEGSEYAVLEALIAADDLPFTQLLVEYHDRFLDDKSRRHSQLLRSLKEAGFVELWSAHGGQEVGYLKVADLPYCEDGTSQRHKRGGGYGVGTP